MRGRQTIKKQLMSTYRAGGWHPLRYRVRESIAEYGVVLLRMLTSNIGRLRAAILHVCFGMRAARDSDPCWRQRQDRWKDPQEK